LKKLSTESLPKKMFWGFNDYRCIYFF
jgi:hypothetical protein